MWNDLDAIKNIEYMNNKINKDITQLGIELLTKKYIKCYFKEGEKIIFLCFHIIEIHFNIKNFQIQKNIEKVFIFN